MMQTLIAIDAERLERLERHIMMLTERLEGATVTLASDWCTVPEAAKRLGVSTATIRRKAASGEMQARGSGKTRQVKIR